MLRIGKGSPTPRVTLFAAMAWGLLAVPAAAQEPPPDTFVQHMLPVLQKYCVSCHGAEEPEGGLDLAKFQTEADAVMDLDVWRRVGERLFQFEMPPEGSPQPLDTERGPVAGWIQAHRPPDADCAQLATDATVNFYPGHVMSRRLSRDEYNNSVRDLTGVDLRPADDFPADGSGGEGFDNVGDTLYLSTVLLEQYLAAADRVLDAALPAAGDGVMFQSPLPRREGSGEGFTDRSNSQRLILIAEPSDALPSNEVDELFGAASGEKPIPPLAPPFEGGGSLTSREAARQVVAAFARRAFRRPVEAAEVERLLGLFDRSQARGEGYVVSVKLALKGVLISPHFLFLVEPEPAERGIYRLGQHQLAARLSYFLWASMPDDELSRLADEGKLYDEGILQQQVRRMLSDPKSRGFAESFAVQWLGIGSLGNTVRPDAERFPEFDDELAAMMRAEAVALVDAVLTEDRSLLELLDGDYAYLNARLAAHYGLPPIEGDELRRVELADRNRGGVLGLGAVLTNTSFPMRTSPVLRGKWVLGEVLGARVPPPPPDAGELPPDDEIPDGLTLRQRLEQHRTRPECASCHQSMDPLGFGLENFDAIGRWRTESAGQPIDSSGTLPSGETFSSPAELKQVLVARKDQFVRNLTRKLVGYAFGRGLDQFDECVIKDSIKALEANDFRSSVLIEQIVLSFPFQHRYSRK